MNVNTLKHTSRVMRLVTAANESLLVYGRSRFWSLLDLTWNRLQLQL